jgi:hypothetical protein
MVSEPFQDCVAKWADFPADEAELRTLQSNVRSLEQAKTKLQEELRKAEHEGE